MTERGERYGKDQGEEGKEERKGGCGERVEILSEAQNKCRTKNITKQKERKSIIVTVTHFN